MKKKVVTGIGVVSSIGLNIDSYYSCLLNEKKLNFEIDDSKENIDSCVLNFDFPEEYKTEQYFDVPLVGHYSLCAVKQAIKNANIIPEEISNRLGLVFATTFGSLDIDLEVRSNIEAGTPKYVPPLKVLVSGKDFAANYCSLNSKVKAFCHTVTGGICSGIQAISLACQALEQNKADVVLVGAADVPPKILIEALGKTENAHLIEGKIGQGAAFIVLETMEYALKRKAHILAHFKDVNLGSQLKNQTNNKSCMQYAPSSIENIVRNITYNIENKDDILICPGIWNKTKDLQNEINAIATALNQEKSELAILHIKKYLGECYSVSTLFQVISAVGLINDQIRNTYNYKGRQFERALITACEENGCIGALMLE